MRKTKFLFGVFLSAALIFQSCNKEELQTVDDTKQSENIYNTEGVPDGMMKLGKKLDNPYSLSNMKKAFAQTTNLKSTAEDLQPTHLYVRFLPETTEEMAILTEDTTLKLYDYPFDYEVIEDGQYYHDPSIPLDKFTWLYTVVKPEYEFPPVNYEILEEIYLPEESEEEAELKSLAITGNLADGNLKSTLASKYKPSGQITLQDNSSNSEPGLRNVQIRLRNWFRIDEVYTNASGSFTAEENFRGKVDIKIIFTNSHYKMRSTLVNLFDNIDYKIANEVTSYKLVICRGDRTGSAPSGWNWKKDNELWAYATISNAVEDYYGYCSTENIGTPPNTIRIWANSNKKDKSWGGSAPMFSHGMKYYTLNWDKWWKYATNVLYIPVTNVLMNVFQWFLPDVIFNFNRNSLESSNELNETVFHELAHASHFNKVGAGFWDNYINYMVNEGSYGDGNGKDADLVAISETWGFHMGWHLCRTKYPTNPIVTLAGEENFVPGQKGGIDVGWVWDASTSSNQRTGWIPRGLMLDLIDTQVDNVRGTFNDNAGAFTNQEIFNALDKDVRSPQQFRDRLMSETSNRDQTDVNSLFEAYYFN